MEHLSKIELYYTSSEYVNETKVTLTGDEFKHAVKVMRNSVEDYLYITDGRGNIYKSKITLLQDNILIAQIINKYKYKDDNEDLFFCIPKLKNPDRMKFAIEKSVELGITNFILFETKFSVSKSVNLKRLKKIALSAMKQSIRSYLPQVEIKTFNQIIESNNTKFLFDQKAKNKFTTETKFSRPAYFIFGPEGGFDQSEIKLINNDNIFRISDNRLRTETAILKCASLISSL